MSTPADQMPDPSGQPQSGLQRYMADYGARLQQAISGNVDTMGTPSVPAANDLGPDLYQSNVRLTQDQPPPQSALDDSQPPQPGQPPPQQGQGGSAAPQSALAGDQEKQTSFQDVWKQQSAAQRQQFIDKLQKHLDATNETIDSAYGTMMKQLGQRPKADLSKQDKGMLLMEFGLRMLSHSAGENTAQAVGNAGTETMDSYKQLRQGRQANQQKYDQMQQQLTQAHDRDKVNLMSRSALEEGRDLRAAQASDASITRVGMQQSGLDARKEAGDEASMDRTVKRGSDAMERTVYSQTHADARSAARLSANAGRTKGTIAGADGYVYIIADDGSVNRAKDQDGNAIKAAPGASGIGGGKKSAQQQAFELYMDVNGKGPDGQPLQGAELQKAQKEALNFSANPKSSASMGDAQQRQIAEKSGDSYIRANPTSWLGMSPEEIAGKRADYVEKTYQRIKRGQPPIAEGQGAPPARSMPQNVPQSALDPTGAPQPGAAPSAAPPAGPAPAGTAPPTRPAAAPARPQSALQPVPQTPSPKPGAIPTQPPPGGRPPNSAQLAALHQDPAKIAPYFLKKFGYLPAGFQRYIQQQQPQSALAR
jgi:hypothetical protein